MTPSIRRRVELDLPLEELWALIATPGGWCDWLVDDVALELAPGRSGSVTLDGEVRPISVREMVEGERVVFEWVSTFDGEASTVTIELDRDGDRPALEISETCAGSLAIDAVAWEVRIALLWVRATLGSPALA